MSESDPNLPPDTPPPLPWVKGEHGTHSVAVIEVLVCRDEFGRVYSFHRPQDGTDETTLLSWPSGGLEQTAFAMLCEAAQREAVLSLLAMMSRDPGYLEGSEEDREARRADLAEKLRVQIGTTVGRIAPDVVRAVFHRVSTQKRG